MIGTEDRFSPQGVELASVGSVVDLIDGFIEVLDGPVRVPMVEVIQDLIFPVLKRGVPRPPQAAAVLVLVGGRGRAVKRPADPSPQLAAQSLLVLLMVAPWRLGELGSSQKHDPFRLILQCRAVPARTGSETTPADRF